METVLYSLVCPLTDEVRYIGKTSQEPGKRLWAHIAAAKRRTTKGGTRKDLWLRKLLRRGLQPKLVIIGTVGDNQHWSAAERAAIAEAAAAGVRLTNMTLGGEGTAISPERRAKLSEAATRRATPEYRAMMAEKSRAAWNDPDKRARITAGITDEVRQKVSTASKRLWQNPEKAARALANISSHQTSEALTERWRSEGYRQKQSAARSSPEYKARLSNSIKLAWERKRQA